MKHAINCFFVGKQNTKKVYFFFRRDSLHLSLIHEPEEDDAGNGTDGGEGTDDAADDSAAEGQKATARTAKKAAAAAVKDRKYNVTFTFDRYYVNMQTLGLHCMNVTSC